MVHEYENRKIWTEDIFGSCVFTNDCVIGRRAIPFPHLQFITGAVLEKNIWGQCPRKKIETQEVPSGERRRRENRGAKADKWGRVWETRLELEYGPENAFWRILKANERSFLHLYADAFTLSNSLSCHVGGKAEVWGTCSPSLQRRTRL